MPGSPSKVTPEMDTRIRNRFPFALTKAQERVIAEIQQDMRSHKPMNRLLQGDVGSGKTVVALYGMLVAVANHFQAAIMAPTENSCANSIMKPSAVTSQAAECAWGFCEAGSARGERSDVLAKTAAGELDIIIGTHALVGRGRSIQESWPRGRG